MRNTLLRLNRLAVGVPLGLALLLVAIATFGGSSLPNPLNSLDSTGILSTFSTNGPIDQTNPFFQSLGTNGRSCGTCHVANDAWTVTPRDIQQRFLFSGGTDPIFRPVDGANCPSADVSTVQARALAYSLLLKKGLIRISLPVPSNADFTIIRIEDPYHCSETTAAQPALYRRPLPATNLPFLTTVMWDGRESPSGHTLTADLTQQATDATLGHAQATSAPTSEQLQEIVDFETGLYTAQMHDVAAGDLTAEGATGGPVNLSTQQFFPGINDVLSPGFNPVAMTDYSAWASLTGTSATPGRTAVARGEAIFNTFPITITGVAGLNSLPGLSTVQGTCTTCHDTPNVANHSLPLAINIGVTAFPTVPALNVSDLPVYTVLCTNTGKTVRTTDLGRAMITGKCADVGKTKGPNLRGLAGRAPYFHNGSAATLSDVVDFYQQRFGFKLTDQQKADLLAFLRAL